MDYEKKLLNLLKDAYIRKRIMIEDYKNLRLDFYNSDVIRYFCENIADFLRSKKIKNVTVSFTNYQKYSIIVKNRSEFVKKIEELLNSFEFRKKIEDYFEQLKNKKLIIFLR